MEFLAGRDDIGKVLPQKVDWNRPTAERLESVDRFRRHADYFPRAKIEERPSTESRDHSVADELQELMRRLVIRKVGGDGERRPDSVQTGTAAVLIVREAAQK